MDMFLENMYLKKTLGKRVEIFNKREYNENALHKKLRKN